MKKMDFLKGTIKLILVLCCLFSFSCAYAQRAVLFRPNADKQGTINLRYGEEVVQAENIALDTRLLVDGPNTFDASLFGNTIQITRINNDLTAGRSFTWWGSVDGDPNSYVLFANSNNIFSANIFWKNTLYQIRYVGNEVYQTRKIDQSKLPPNKAVDDIQGTLMAANKTVSSCTNTDSPWVIDVMVVYSNNALAFVGDKNTMESEIYLAASETNLAYLKSNIAQRIAIVFVGQINRNDSGNVISDLRWLRDTSNAPSIRDAHAADLVVMIVESLDVNGKAYKVHSPIRNDFEQFAYCVVRRKNATIDYSFAHELAHLMGANHDCEGVPGPISSIYSHGYKFLAADGKIYGTIMNCSDCEGNFIPRVPFFSNPSITHMGAIIGNNTDKECQADNHQVLNNTASIVANFRCHSSRTANVWMKDTWNDTGAEPDPLTVGEDMWNSPNIWIRNERDTALIFNHQHQNPIPGETNWVYVKLHNGGLKTTGSLELHYADANLSLSWPGSWTRLVSIPVTVAESTSEIIEYKWNTPTAGIDYTMIARWVAASDSMVSAEGTDVGLNVRNNNNIAWKNLKLIDLVNNVENRVAMRFVAKKETSLELNFENTFPNNSFVETGSVRICFDFRTIKAMGGSPKGTGFTKLNWNTYLATSSKVVFESLGTTKEHTGKIKLHFLKTKNTPKQKYYCSVKQVLADEKSKGKMNPIGGISYQLNLDY